VKYSSYSNLGLTYLKLVCLVKRAFVLSFYLQYSSVSFWMRCDTVDIWWTKYTCIFLPLSAFRGGYSQAGGNTCLDWCPSIVQWVMLQWTVFFFFLNNIRRLQWIQMLQQTRRNTISQRSACMRMTCRAFLLWLVSVIIFVILCKVQLSV